MKYSVKNILIISLSIFSVGCATTSRVQAPDDAITLGLTTPEQITARLGPPGRVGYVIKNDQQMEAITYFFGTSGKGSDDPEAAGASRFKAFYFFGDKLVGYEFASSWKEDSTNFDSRKVAKIKKGESTKDDVVRLFGKPGGEYIYPIIPNKDEEALNYFYNIIKKSGSFEFRPYHKLLVITFNQEGIVTNVEYDESGQQ
jgi:SmpA / OmlA family